MKNTTVYIDESGTLPDPKDKLVVVAAVGTPSPERIDTIFKQAKSRRIPDTPENYAALCRHFSRRTDLDRFNYSLGKIINKQISILHVQSVEEKRVNIADMIAGATLAKETGKDSRFYEMFERKVVSVKRVNWVEVKKRFIAQKKLA